LFLAVIGAYFRRAGHDCARRGVYQVGDVQLDADTHELTIAGASIQLSPKQFGILHAFMSAPSKVFTRSELIDRVWGPGFAIGEHTLDVHIHALRQLLNRDSKQRCRLIAIKGVGFKLKMLQPSIPVLPLGAELPTVSTARPARHVGAVHDPIARSTAVAIPAKVRRGAALRRSVRRRLGQSRAEIPFVRRGYEAVSVG
jgi:DNA-binding winged helix-turn-helix (wHTH) protein